MNKDSFSSSKTSVLSCINDFIISSTVSSRLKILICGSAKSEAWKSDLQRAPLSKISLAPIIPKGYSFSNTTKLFVVSDTLDSIEHAIQTLSILPILEIGDEEREIGNKSSKRHSCNSRFFPVLIDWNNN